MFNIDLDFEDVEAAVPYEPVPAGIYVLQIESAVIKNPAPNPQAEEQFPGLSIKFSIVDHDNKSVNWWGSLSPKSRPFFKQFLNGIFSAETYPARIAINSEEEAQEFCAGLIGLTCTAGLSKQRRKDNNTKFQNAIDEFIAQ